MRGASRGAAWEDRRDAGIVERAVGPGCVRVGSVGRSGGQAALVVAAVLRAGRPGLGSARRLGHDDRVDAKHRDGGLAREAER